MYFTIIFNKLRSVLTRIRSNAFLPLLVVLAVTQSACVLMPDEVTKPVKKKSKVAIILSAGTPAYTEIAEALSKKLGNRARTYNLDNDIANTKAVLKKVRRSGSEQVVAIGLMAAKTASALKNTQVVFCQVFNYEGENIIKPWMKGVSLVPDHKLLFSTWKKLDPTIKHVAVITGNKKEAFIASAKKKAAKYKIKLTHKVVKTDLDFIYTIKNLPEGVQGIWLLPDNRVRSVRAIREVMSFGVKRGKQVILFSSSLLKLGGLFSVGYRPQDVVRQVLQRLDRSVGKKQIPGASVQMLSRADIRISPNTAKRLGMKIPKAFEKYIHD